MQKDKKEYISVSNKSGKNSMKVWIVINSMKMFICFTVYKKSGKYSRYSSRVSKSCDNAELVGTLLEI